MKKMKVAVALLAFLLLGACVNEEKKVEQDDDEKVGYSVTGGSIEEAENIPEEEQEAIKTAFDKYITTFNEQDVDGYIEIIGGDYDVEEERAFLESHFESFEQEREASNVTIVKYNDEEAQVFANIDNRLKQLSTGLETKDTIKQVTVFIKENDDWKVKSVHSIGENPSEK